eukprot:TRINITY_DN25141_c0_g1_i2.p1 TRINITY_DN25141_c0_g1~~TRINITY_DN25141_c0_g1_i2.p1  ORF type:complete len:227 (-),score=40.50 TRINITY_DN25141_c0_g1_i2:26-706(-)
MTHSLSQTLEHIKLRSASNASPMAARRRGNSSEKLSLSIIFDVSEVPPTSTARVDGQEDGRDDSAGAADGAQADDADDKLDLVRANEAVLEEGPALSPGDGLEMPNVVQAAGCADATVESASTIATPAPTTCSDERTPADSSCTEMSRGSSTAEKNEALAQLGFSLRTIDKVTVGASPHVEDTCIPPEVSVMTLKSPNLAWPAGCSWFSCDAAAKCSKAVVREEVL